MPINVKEVTDGYWYVECRFEDDGYRIVKVEGNRAYHCGSDAYMPVFSYRFIAPVMSPNILNGEFESTEQLLSRLRQELNLSATAPIMEIFRKAAVVAREVADKAKQDSP